MISSITQVSDGVGYLKASDSMAAIPVLLSTAYLPNLEYLVQVIKNDKVVLETQEHFIKQTFRNRCEVLTSNGKLALSIPLVKQADKELIRDKKISYAENWQLQHWRTISSAYKNSPYFEYFEDEFKYFYENKFELLFDYNLQLLQSILKILRIKKEFSFTEQYESEVTHCIDLRSLSSGKQTDLISSKPYYQVFSDKYGFTPNLSCMDALFNEGLKTIELL